MLNEVKQRGRAVQGKPHIAPAEAHGEEMLTNLIKEGCLDYCLYLIIAFIRKAL